jgi:hypothetical protein
MMFLTMGNILIIFIFVVIDRINCFKAKPVYDKFEVEYVVLIPLSLTALNYDVYLYLK